MIEIAELQEVSSCVQIGWLAQTLRLKCTAKIPQWWSHPCYVSCTVDTKRSTVIHWKAGHVRTTQRHPEISQERSDLGLTFPIWDKLFLFYPRPILFIEGNKHSLTPYKYVGDEWYRRRKKATPSSPRHFVCYRHGYDVIVSLAVKLDFGHSHRHKTVNGWWKTTQLKWLRWQVSSPMAHHSDVTF